MAHKRKTAPIVFLILAAVLWYFNVMLLFVSLSDIWGAKLLQEYQLILIALLLATTVLLMQVYKNTKKHLPQED